VQVAATDDGPTDTAQHLKEAVLERAGSARCVMLVGHNMGWEQAASHYAGEHVPMKTAYAVLLESPCSGWKEAFQEQWQLKAVVKPESSKS
jgi:phosphohistidine phosphatase SixA